MEKKTNELRARGLLVASDKLEALARIREDTNRADDANHLSEISRRLREKWRDIVADAYTNHAKQLNARFLAMIESMKKVVVRLDAVSVKLKDANRDTTALDAGIARIKADLNTLSTRHDALKAEFDAATTPQQKAAVIYKARRLMLVGHRRLTHDIQLVRKLVVLQTRLNSGTQADISVATDDATQLEAQIDAQGSLETQLATADAQAQADAAVNTDDSEDGGDRQ